MISQLFDVELAVTSFPYIIGGLGFTLYISVGSFIVSLIGGLCLALMRLSRIKLLSPIARVYISFFRGVPALVTLFYIYFGLPFVGINLDASLAAIAGFGLTSAAYSAEIIRAAIMGIDRGQWEAALTLGMNAQQTLRRIVLPQAYRIALPSLSNVLLSLVKSSSLAAMITVPDIFQRAKIIGGAHFDYLTMYAVVAFIYWGICVLFEMVQEKLEQWCSY